MVLRKIVIHSSSVEEFIIVKTFSGTTRIRSLKTTCSRKITELFANEHLLSLMKRSCSSRALKRGTNVGGGLFHFLKI